VGVGEGGVGGEGGEVRVWMEYCSSVFRSGFINIQGASISQAV
jgi:hypothetical protein